MINPLELTGKQVLVAGATSGIGKAIVSLLSDLGAKIVIADDSEEGIKTLISGRDGNELRYYVFNIYDQGIIEARFKQISEECGAFDGFVYCAGTGGVRPLSVNNSSFIHEIMNSNLYSFIEMARCITRKNSFNRGGSIVALSSVSSIKGLKSKTAYSASKAALDAAVRCMAAELGVKGIRVNSVLKGWVSSDMDKEFIKTNMELGGNDDLNRQFLGVIDPADVAESIAFLLSDASRLVSGISLVLDGGYSL
jgi:NAD(P)-dependent dehydrogenase (short-subunit alcohol dehydrogenase family)